MGQSGERAGWQPLGDLLPIARGGQVPKPAQGVGEALQPGRGEVRLRWMRGTQHDGHQAAVPGHDLDRNHPRGDRVPAGDRGDDDADDRVRALVEDHATNAETRGDDVTRTVHPAAELHTFPDRVGDLDA